MEQPFIDNLPIKIIYSFETLFKELEASEYNFGEFNAFLEYLKVTRPELIDGVETFEDFEKLIHNVEPIIDKIIPKPFIKYNLKAITFPFSDKFIFATDRLKEFIENKTSSLKFNYEHLDYETLYKFCCCFILSKYYHKNLEFNLSNQLVIENENGYKTYLGTDINHDYFKIFPSENKFELSEDEIDDLLNNYEDTSLWMEKIPIGSWIAKGFNLVSFFDNTTEIALSNLKSKLLSYGEPFDIVRSDIISALKSIFRINELEVGFSAYNSDKNQLEISHLLQLNNSLLMDHRKKLKLTDIACTDLQNKISKADYYVVSSVDAAFTKFPQDKMLKIAKNSGIKSLILYPLKNGNSCLGVLEIASKEDEKSIIEEYLKKLDSTTGLYYVERKKFDQSIAITNSLLSNKLDAFQKDAQEIFPHYYERFKTDGIDYNLYVGRSIAPLNKFSYQNIREIRYWQLQAMIALEQGYKNIQKNNPLKLEVASLLYATNTTLDILFKLDEKRFDVNGYNNAKYEIVKKRLSKAFVKGSNERINQPHKICIIYTEDILREEYTNYINLLIKKGFLKNDIEYLEIDDLQGLSGLLAIRVSVNYKNKLEEYKKLEE